MGHHPAADIVARTDEVFAPANPSDLSAATEALNALTAAHDHAVATLARIGMTLNPAGETMSLRDHYAGKALEGLVGTLMTGADKRLKIAMLSFAYADSMMEVRDLDPAIVKLNVENSKSSLGGV